MSRPLRIVSVLALAAVAFGWGAATVRYRLFPYELLRSVAGRGGAEDQGDHDPQPGYGLWHKMNPDAPAAVDPKEIANLPYAGGNAEAVSHGDGILLNETDAVCPGLNLVVSGHKPYAALIEATGEVRQEWTCTFEDVWPDLEIEERRAGHRTLWRRAHAFPDRTLLAIFDGIGMVKLDHECNVLWGNPGRYHHDMHVAADGSIWTLSRHLRREHPGFRLDGPIEEDFICKLSADGEEVERISVLSCFLDSDYRSWLSLARREGDLLHTNTITMMDGRFADRHPLFAAGNALISVPALNAIAVVDLARRKVIWALGGLWTFQHEPTVTEAGNILVFDNNGANGMDGAARSRVVEVDPLTQKIVWSYRHSEAAPFHSYFLGSCQRLPNGNTLITESTRARAFEVTPAGEKVWDYLNPFRSEDGELIASLLEVVRYPPDRFEF